MVTWLSSGRGKSPEPTRLAATCSLQLPFLFSSLWNVYICSGEETLGYFVGQRKGQPTLPSPFRWAGNGLGQGNGPVLGENLMEGAFPIKPKHKSLGGESLCHASLTAWTLHLEGVSSHLVTMRQSVTDKSKHSKNIERYKKMYTNYLKVSLHNGSRVDWYFWSSVPV